MVDWLPIVATATKKGMARVCFVKSIRIADAKLSNSLRVSVQNMIDIG